MEIRPEWLPPLMLLNDYAGDWKRYIEEVYSAFYADFIQSQPRFRGRWVRCRRDPIFDGKEAGFWHCTSEGKDERNRTPDIRRCERIRWARAVIENGNDGHYVDAWAEHGGRRGTTWQIWYDEQYLVILGQRRNGERFQLITAYCTDRRHTIERLRRRRDRYTNG